MLYSDCEIHRNVESVQYDVRLVDYHDSPSWLILVVICLVCRNKSLAASPTCAMLLIASSIFELVSLDMVAMLDTIASFIPSNNLS